MPDFIDLKLPNNLTLNDIYGGPSITPLDRLVIIEDGKFEELTEVWAYEKIGQKYKEVKRFGGPGDKGRDIVGYYEENYPYKIDIYQCKHYKDQLSFSGILKEFAKLCYYTFIKKYPIPQKYYLVSPRGCGTTLRTDYIDNPNNINKKLCDSIKDEKIKVDKIQLSSITGFIHYVETFNFSITEEVTPLRLIEEFSKSKYYPYYFGGGLRNFNPGPPNKPDSIQKEEEIYINQLLEVYSELDGKNYSKVTEIDSQYIEHFEMQRTFYYTIESFRRAVRDSLPSMELFDQIEDTINQGINDITTDPTINGFTRLKNSLERTILMNLDSCQLKNYLKPNDKKGVCHRLANANKVRWILK